MATSAERYRDRLLPVLDHVRNHLDEPLRLDRLAALAHLSKFHFHRVFKAVQGETVGAHVARLRLEKALLLIRFSATRSLAQIALDSGYSSQSALSRDFRRHFGVPPGKARRILRAAEPAAAGLKLPRPLPRPAPEALDGRIEVNRQPARNLLCLTRHGRYDFRLGWTWIRLMAKARALGCLSPASRKVGIIYDDPDVSPGAMCRYDAGLTVGEVPTSGTLLLRRFDSHTCATLPFDGAFSELGPALDSIYANWLVNSGFEPADMPPYMLFEGPLSEYRKFALCVPIQRT